MKGGVAGEKREWKKEEYRKNRVLCQKRKNKADFVGKRMTKSRTLECKSPVEKVEGERYQ